MLILEGPAALTSSSGINVVGRTGAGLDTDTNGGDDNGDDANDKGTCCGAETV